MLGGLALILFEGVVVFEKGYDRLPDFANLPTSVIEIRLPELLDV